MKTLAVIVTVLAALFILASANMGRSPFTDLLTSALCVTAVALWICVISTMDRRAKAREDRFADAVAKAIAKHK